MKQHIAEMVRHNTKNYGEKIVFQEFTDSETLLKWTWDEFLRDINKVAAALYHWGIKEQDNIGIFSQNMHQWLIADVGIMALRAVSVPFYSTSTAAQLSYIINETEMEVLFVGNMEQAILAYSLMSATSLRKIVVFTHPKEEKFADGIISWTDFLNIGQTEDFEGVDQRLNEAKAEDLATIIYTSGTTGEPKGVMLDHQNFMSTFILHDKRLSVYESDLSLAFLPLSHIFERSWSLYMLYKGATNHFLKNPRKVVEEMQKVHPQLMCTVPRFFEKTREGIQKEYDQWPIYKKGGFNWAMKIGEKRANYVRKAKALPLTIKWRLALAEKLVFKTIAQIFGGKVRYMPCAGAAMSPQALTFFHSAGIFVNYGYGATETTATVSCFREDKYDFNSSGTVMPGLDVQISDKGEILISGPTVFKGYYKKPEETAKHLQNGCFHSGDKGLILENNQLLMTDRIKDLMKTSVGKYISPQKLELLMTGSKYIEQIVIIAEGRKFVSALIVPSVEHLRAFAESQQIKAHDLAALINHTDVRKMMEELLAELQKDLLPHEWVKNFTLIAEPFSIENKMMTNTLKVRRSVVLESYKKEIDALYQ